MPEESVIEIPKILLFPTDFKDVLTLEEIAALNADKSLQFSVDNFTYSPPKGQSVVAEILHQYCGSLHFWHHVDVYGEFKVERSVINPSNLTGRLHVIQIIGNERNPPERYIFSNLRPWMEAIGTVDDLTINGAALHSMNVGWKKDRTAEIISFYGITSEYHEKSSWSIHCLRQSKVLEK